MIIFNKLKQLYKYIEQRIFKIRILKYRYIYRLKTYLSFKDFGKYINLNEFKKHTLITGMTWSGKSELLKYITFFLIYNFKDKGSIIVCDPHWDVANEIISHKYIRQDDFVYFHPQLFKYGTFGINPFWYKLKDDEIEVYASELSLVFEEMIKSGSSLTLNMKSLLVPCITVLLKRKNSSLVDLQRFMGENNEDLIKLWTEDSNPSIANFFRSEFNNQIYSITKQSISVKIQSLLNSHIFTKIVTASNCVDIRLLIEQKKNIIFNLSKGLLWTEVSQALWRFIIALTQSIAISRAKVVQKNRTPTYLIIDEFTNYTTKSVKNILEESRKYKLHLVIATQILWKNINPALKETILSNCNIKIIWANSYSQQLALSKETGIEKEKLLDLRVWSFYIKSKFSTARLYKVPKIFIWNRYRFKKIIVELFYRYQIKKYYKIEIKKLPLFLKPMFDIKE